MGKLTKNFDNIRLSLVRFRLRRRLKRCRYVHLIYNDKFAVPFVDFINRNFPTDDHIFLCVKKLPFPFPRASNVFEVKSYFKKINLDRPNIGKIICHSLFVPEIVEYFYNHPDLLRTKACWMIYGGDLYNAPRDEKNDFVRCNFSSIITDTDGDECVFFEKYKVKIPYVNAGYAFPITQEMINAAKRVPHDFVQIQVNNSCDLTTLEMLDELKRFAHDDIIVTTILSYGDMSCKDRIIAVGKDLFGEKFKPVMDYMSPKAYANNMAQNDILILNQRRQQGLGNSFAALSLGVKLYIRSNVTTNEHFNSKGIKVYDTESIRSIKDIKELCRQTDSDRRNNMKNSAVFFDDKYLAALWAKVFEGTKEEDR